MGHQLSTCGLKRSYRNDLIAAVAAAAGTADDVEIESFNEMFDDLPIEDLISVGKTCKRLQEVAGHYFSQNYSDIEIASTPKTLQIINYDVSDANVTHFAQSIGKIQLFPRHGLQHLLSVQTKLCRLNQLKICRNSITQSDVDRMTQILSKVEVLRFFYCDLKFHEIMAYCPQLRRLQVRSIQLNKTNYDWLVRKCPTLECFEFIPYQIDAEAIEKVTMFLELNPNIRRFAVKIESLLKHLLTLIKSASDIKLNELAILVDCDVQIAPFCQLLNEFHKREVYKRLLVYRWGQTNQEMIDQLATVGGLVKLNLGWLKDRVSLATLENLEELCVDDSSNIADLENMAKNLINLNRIYFECANFDDLRPFIKQSAALDIIKVDLLNHGIHFSEETNAIDLSAVNREREQLSNAQKITLYAEEKVYLATKWALKQTEFSLICLKRKESFEWDSDFE